MLQERYQQLWDAAEAQLQAQQQKMDAVAHVFLDMRQAAEARLRAELAEREAELADSRARVARRDAQLADLRYSGLSVKGCSFLAMLITAASHVGRQRAMYRDAFARTLLELSQQVDSAPGELTLLEKSQRLDSLVTSCADAIAAIRGVRMALHQTLLHAHKRLLRAHPSAS